MSDDSTYEVIEDHPDGDPAMDEPYDPDAEMEEYDPPVDEGVVSCDENGEGTDDPDTAAWHATSIAKRLLARMEG